MGLEKEKPLLCFGDLVWNNGFERNHSIVVQLVNSGLFSHCVYVEPSIWLSECFSNKKTMRRLFLRPDSILEGKIRLKNLVHFIPFKNRIFYLKRFEDWIFNKIITSSVNSDNFALLVNRVALDIDDIIVNLINKSKFSIFDFSDDFVEFASGENERESIKRYLDKIVSKVDLVVHVNEHVYDRYKYLNNNNIVLRNATNFCNFNRIKFETVPFFEDLKVKYNKIIGYIGTANSIRLDIEAIKEMLGVKPGWAFVFVGNTENAIKDKLRTFSNAYFFDFVPYFQLPDYINYFDVCTAPVQLNNHTLGNDLLKLHDYLAMGKPVVSADIGGAKDLEFVSIYNGKKDFITKIEFALSNSDSNLTKLRKKMAYQNSWEFRISPLIEYLRSEA